MDIEILELITGARKASGLAVIIDVFRAFSLECYLCEFGAGEIRPVETIEETFAWREKDRDCVLVGE
ncbi:MAG: 2-phosphosulfolactate phosphatase, partial [Lachnospiraceae bacterium]|nr:2-phosphosulfolactate phosphatase [Lachnospiraceae bacterium]